MTNINLHKWRIYCETDNKYEYTWNDKGVTQCPIDNGHTVSDESVIINTIRGVKINHTDSPYIYNNKSMLCDTSLGDITINLLHVSRKKNKLIYIKKISTNNTVYIYPYQGDYINDSTSGISLTGLNEILSVRSDGITNWIDTDFNNILQSDIPDSDIKSDIKGDIVVDNGKELKKLSVGNDNDILTANSNTSLGVTWASVSTMLPSKSIYSCTFNHNKSTPYIATKSSNITLTTFVYPGSNKIGSPVEIYIAISSRNTGDEAEYTLIDNTNSKKICTGTYTTSSTRDEIILNTSISNIPTGQAIFELYGRTKSGKEIRYQSFLIR